MGTVRPLRGTGAGWRPEIAAVLAGTDGLGFCEVIAESVRPDAVPRPVRDLAGRGAAVVPHGVRLSLGGTDPLDPARVTHLAACASAVDAPLVSEHVAFVRAGGREAGHLLPVPRTREALDVLARNISRMQAELDVPLAVEPVAALFDWPDDEFDEAGFLTRLLDRTGALLLLDVANVYANARNRDRDPRAVLDALPLDRVAYCHVAGGTEHDGWYHDTHTTPVPDAVLELLGHVARRCPAPPPVLLERDGHHPPAARTWDELAVIARTAGHAVVPGPVGSVGSALPAGAADPGSTGPDSTGPDSTGPDSTGFGGTGFGGASFGGAESGAADPRGADPRGADPGGAGGPGAAADPGRAAGAGGPAGGA